MVFNVSIGKIGKQTYIKRPILTIRISDMPKFLLGIIIFCGINSYAQKVDVAYVDSLIYFTQYLGADESKADSLILMGDIIEQKGFEIDYKLGAIYGYRFKGWAYDYKGDYETAISYFLKFLKAANEESFEAEKLMAYGDLGGLYSFMGRYEDAKMIFQKATQDEKFRKEQPQRLSTFYNNLGTVYTNLNKRDSALLMYNKSLELKRQTNDSLGILNLKTNLSSFLIEEGQTALAEKYILENIAFCRQLDKKGDLWHNYINYGQLKTKQNKYREAENYYQNALNLAEELDNEPFRKDSYAALANIYEKLGNYKKALKMEQSFKAVSENLLNQETNNKISQLREEFNAEERENRNRLLNLELNSKKTQQGFLIIGIVLLALLAAVIAFALRKNRLKNKLLEQQNTLIGKQRDKLTSLNEDKNNLISIISHDLRSPFNTIALWNQQLKSFLNPSSEKAIEAVMMIDKTAKYGQEMVNNILDIEKIELNTHQVQMELVDTNQLLTELIADFKPASKSKNIEILFQSDLKTSILSDPSLLRRAIENLLSNALKFSFPDSSVWVKVASNEKQVAFQVKDEGQGIPEEEQTNLFSKYGQTSTESTAGEASTGLGLSIVKRIANELGGTIAFESEKGVGSTFTLTLAI